MHHSPVYQYGRFKDKKRHRKYGSDISKQLTGNLEKKQSENDRQKDRRHARPKRKWRKDSRIVLPKRFRVSPLLCDRPRISDNLFRPCFLRLNEKGRHTGDKFCQRWVLVNELQVARSQMI